MQVSVSAVAKISEDESALQKAASQLINKSPQEIRRTVEATLEGHTRDILATEPSPDPSVSKLAGKIRTAAETDLAAMGIGLQSLFLKIRDPKSKASEGIETIERLNRELHRLDLRIRRIEEKVGLGSR